MATDIKITDLDPAPPLTGAEQVAIARDGVSYRALVAAIADLAGTGGGENSAAVAAAATATTKAAEAASSATSAASSASAASTSATNAAASATAAAASASSVQTAADQVEAALVGLNVRTYWADQKRADNSGNGLSEATAKKTISAAVAAHQANDVIFVRRGKDQRHRVTTLHLLANTHVVGYGGGDRAIFDFSKDILNNGFATVSGYDKVYAITVNYATLFPDVHPTGLSEIGSQQFFQLFEGPPGSDVRLVLENGFFNYIPGWSTSGRNKADALAYVQANPGTFHVRYGDDTALPNDTTGAGTTFIFYVHPPGSTNPITNGKAYAVSSCYGDGYKQRDSGSCSGIWFTRSGHRNGCQFERHHTKDCRFDQYAVHGCFHNSAVVEDSESEGQHECGACFHAYRDFATSPDDGVVYRRCRTKSGAWGFFGHSFGDGIHSQYWARFDDCVVEDAIMAISADTYIGFVVNRGVFKNIRKVTPSANGVYNYTFIEVSPGGSTLFNIEVFTESAKFYHCILQGGSPGARMTNVSGGATIDLYDTTCSILDDADQGYGAFVKLVRSSWEVAKYIVSATDSYVTAVLDHNGDCPTNVNITNCFGPNRRFSVARTPSGNMTATSVKIWPKGIDVQCRGDFGTPEDSYGRLKAMVGLYGTAADMALLKVGTPVWLYQDGQRQWDCGIYFVTAVSGNSVTLDREIKLPFTMGSYTYQDQGDPARAVAGDWSDQKPTPTLQVRLPQATVIDRTTVTLTLSGGTVFTPGVYGGFGSKKIDDEYGYSSDRNFVPVVSGEDTGTATLAMTVRVADLLPTYVVAEHGMRRLTGYLRDFGVGGKL
jgi:hypothetical protein